MFSFLDVGYQNQASLHRRHLLWIEGLTEVTGIVFSCYFTLKNYKKKRKLMTFLPYPVPIDEATNIVMLAHFEHKRGRKAIIYEDFSFFGTNAISFIMSM